MATATRKAISTVTILVLIGLLLAGAYFGWRSISAPLPGGDEPAKADQPRCEDGVARGDVVRTDEVTVSVYNAGSRSGLADQTRSELTARGFIAGDAGNAPAALEDVRSVRVLAPTKKDPTARLVALQFGSNTYVQPTEEDLGPGVEIVVGDDFVGLVDAPSRIKARSNSASC